MEQKNEAEIQSFDQIEFKIPESKFLEMGKHIEIPIASH